MTFRTITEARPLRAAVAGGGFHGRRWTEALRARSDIELVDAPGGLAEVLEAERPDFLVNCAPADARRGVTLAALERGAAVLEGGPVASGFDAVGAQVAAADRAERLLVLGSGGCPAELADRVAKLGPPVLVSVEFAVPFRPPGGPAGWREPLLRTVAGQLFDTARAVTGREALSVCGTGSDPVTAVFQLSGGVPFLFSASWSPKGEPTSWHGRWQVVGERGTLRWDGPGDPGGEEPSGPAGALDGFVAALRTGAAPPGECHDRLRSLAMVEAAAESASSGQLAVVAG